MTGDILAFLEGSLIYWKIFPVAIVIASLANSSGFGGGIIFQPIFIGIMGLHPAQGVATGMLTELCGMSSGAIRYFRQKQIEFDIAFSLIIFGIPGLIIGNHLLTILSPGILKFIFGSLVLTIAIWTFVSAIQRKKGTRYAIGVDEVYPVFWVPFLGGISSGVSSVGTAESMFPLLERYLKVQPHRAIATAILIEAAMNWLATALNLSSGLIRWEVAIYTIPGVIIGGQIGPQIARWLPSLTLKYLFGTAIAITAIHMIYKSLM
ncbi:MAG: sulfite exporter TauE/SafE family protein [Deltaproteobacteria bacterium]|nr:sulfite exporter TauE/SafE family protein [Deltaproteobacteria bacterium]